MTSSVGRMADTFFVSHVSVMGVCQNGDVSEQKESAKPMPMYGTIGVPNDALPFVQSYLEAGTGDEAISTKMPLLIWLVFMEHTPAVKMLDAISRTMRGSGAMQAMFADKWCREILLEKMPPLSPAKEADEGPNQSIVMDFNGGTGIEASPFVIACLHGRIMNKEINASTFAAGYGTLSDLLRRWKEPEGDYSAGGTRMGGQPGGWDQLVRDTLFHIVSNWGKKVKEGGTVNRNFAAKLFQAMGGLGP